MIALSKLPLLAMDAGVGARNLLTKSNYELPSSMFTRLLDEHTLPPEGIGKAAEFVSSSLVGAGLPGPTIKNPAPSSFVSSKIPTPRDLTLQKAQQADLVVPPSTTNPTVTNRMLESFGGKNGLEQDARAINTRGIDALAKKAVGIPEDSPVTIDALKAIRSQASAPHEAIRNTGTVVTDENFSNDVAKVLSKYKSAAGVSKELAKTDLADLANSFEKSFPSSDAIDAIQVLRDRATTAYGKGDSELGKGRAAPRITGTG
jgi:hypothetical protein